MNISLVLQNAAEFSTPLLAVFVVDTATGKDADPALVLLADVPAIAEAASTVLGTGEFRATLGETLLLHAPSGLAAERLLLVGLGKAKDLTTAALHKGAGAALRAAKPRGLRDAAVLVPGNHRFAADAAVLAMAEGALLAEPEWDTYRTDRKDLSVHSFTLVAPPSDSGFEASMQTALSEAVAIAGGQNAARELINEPGNVLTPTELGRRAAGIAGEAGLHFEVYSTDTLKDLGMGAFLAVAQGSAEPPALIVLTYEPEQKPADDAPIFGLVGKGITFDTGGISIKPADGMDKMKYDMSGAAAMIGAMQALAALKPSFKVISVICSAENMPSSTAYKPGDIVTAMSGKTIEVLNTDAEGRMVLADGLHYAKTLGCTHLINAATLTGAVAVALGKLNAGLFSNSDADAEKFLAAAKVTGEGYWRLPCTDDYRDQIQSVIADIQNTGMTRYGGAITAAMFLKEFVGETPWIHLDIAACAWNDDAKPWLPKGPAGVGVRTIVEWVLSYTR